MNELTPQQAADVIRYIHDNANRERRENGWNDNFSLGQAAIRAASPEHTLLPDGVPMLTSQARNKGFTHLDNPQESQRSEEYWKRFDDLVDNKAFTPDQAHQSLKDDGIF